MAINKPNEVYWEEKVGFSEKAWVLLSIVACIVMFMVMVAWAIAGKQNPPNEAYRVSIPSFAERAEAFIEKYKVDEENGIPVVEAPEDEDSYLIAPMVPNNNARTANTAFTFIRFSACFTTLKPVTGQVLASTKTSAIF